MARVCPVGLDTVRLRQEIQSIYSRVAVTPSDDFHFHRGPAYAVEFLNYDVDALARLPAETTACFAGVGNPHRIARLTPGATVVDVGCGAGTDLLLAGAAVGPGGKAIGVDMTEPMLERAGAAAGLLGLRHVELRLGDLLELPVESASADFVVSNGVMNLATDKERAFGEVHRILKPGGQFLYADIIVASELPDSVRRDVDLWAG